MTWRGLGWEDGRGMRLIPNEHLRTGDVPPPEAGWREIGEFALTFDGYERWGSFDACAEVAHARRHDTLDDLRTCLFFEQRRWRHFGEAPDRDAMAYVRELVEKIRACVARSRPS